jgi:hypothetical protein
LESNQAGSLALISHLWHLVCVIIGCLAALEKLGSCGEAGTCRWLAAVLLALSCKTHSTSLLQS